MGDVHRHWNRHPVTYARSLRPAAKLIGALVGVTLGTLARTIDRAAVKILTSL